MDTDRIRIVTHNRTVDNRRRLEVVRICFHFTCFVLFLPTEMRLFGFLLVNISVMLSIVHAFHVRGMARSFSALSMARSEAPANPVALVTGASRGIGRAIALALGEAGCKVVVNYAANSAAAEEVVKEIEEKGGSKGAKAITLKANCANVDEVTAMFEKIVEEVRLIVVCFNC